MVTLLTLTSSASLAGVLVYRRLGNNKGRFTVRQPQEQPQAQAWWKTSWQNSQEMLQRGLRRFTLRNQHSQPKSIVAAQPLRFALHKDDATVAYGLRASLLALGVTTAGKFFFPPLQVAGVPLLLIMGIPSAQAAYDQLWVDGRPNRVLAETVALAVCLAGGYYWVGALGFWLYHGGRSLLTAQQGEVDQPPAGLMLPTAQLWKDGTAHTVALDTLQPGDQVLLQSGEMVPMDGLIIEGLGWLRPAALPTTAGLQKGVGDQVAATDIVLVGRLCVRVLPMAGGQVSHGNV